MKLSILRVDEALPDLRLRSMHNPEKKDKHHLRNCGRSHPGLFGLDIHGEKALKLAFDSP
jgi:hypothetical protein